MTIYHGSQNKILAPIFGQGKPYNDYGQGFYCTENLELAKDEYRELKKESNPEEGTYVMDIIRQKWENNDARLY